MHIDKSIDNQTNCVIKTSNFRYLRSCCKKKRSSLRVFSKNRSGEAWNEPFMIHLPKRHHGVEKNKAIEFRWHLNQRLSLFFPLLMNRFVLLFHFCTILLIKLNGIHLSLDGFSKMRHFQLIIDQLLSHQSGKK